MKKEAPECGIIAAKGAADSPHLVSPLKTCLGHCSNRSLAQRIPAYCLAWNFVILKFCLKTHFESLGIEAVLIDEPLK